MAKSVLRMQFSILLMIQLCSCSSLFSLWETNCKMHADNKHEELKGIMKDQNKFNIDNWVHSTLVIIMVFIGILFSCTCCVICYKLIPIFSVFTGVRNATQTRNNPHQHVFNPPYTSPITTGHTVHIKEILPSQ